MSIKKQIYKISIRLFILGIFCLLTGLLFVKNYWKSFTTESEMESVVSEIKQSEKLPELFYQMYDFKYPNITPLHLRTET